MQNLLCNLMHNEKDIWYCKHEFILDDFESIKKLDNDVIFICGNSDYSFDEFFLQKKPSKKTGKIAGEMYPVYF